MSGLLSSKGLAAGGQQDAHCAAPGERPSGAATDRCCGHLPKRPARSVALR